MARNFRPPWVTRPRNITLSRWVSVGSFVRARGLLVFQAGEKVKTAVTRSKDENAASTASSTLAVHGEAPREHAHHAVTTPIICSSTYVFEDTTELRRYFDGHIER